MQQGQKTTKKWVDYSDDSEEQFDSEEEEAARGGQRCARPGAGSAVGTVDHRSEQFVQQQLARYRQAKQNSEEIWLLVESEDASLLDKKIRDLKDSQNKEILNIYKSRDVPGAWDVKVKETAATTWLTDGIDRQKNIKITVAERNFSHRERGERARERGGRDRGDRGQRRDRERGERGERGGRGGRRGGRDRERGDRDGRRNRDHNNEPQKKKVYVDKVTGQAPSNKQECEQKVLQEKQRHYTRQEAEKVGEGLGNFRNKPKVEAKVESLPQRSFVKPEAKTELRGEMNRPKEEGKAWARKQREQLKEDKQRREAEQEPLEKKADVAQVKEKRPDVQQVRQKKVEYREKHEQAAKEETNKASDALPEKKKPKRHYVRVDNLTEEEKEKLKIKKPQKKDKDFLSEDSN